MRAKNFFILIVIIFFGLIACLKEHPYDHCFNGKEDRDQREEGTDCGGDCPPCQAVVDTSDVDTSSVADPPFEIRTTDGDLMHPNRVLRTHLFKIDPNIIAIFSDSQPIEFYNIAEDNFFSGPNDAMLQSAAYAQLNPQHDQTHGDIFICGGKELNGKASTRAFLLNAGTQPELNELDTLKIPKYNHTVNAFDNNIMMILGGSDNTNGGAVNGTKSAEFYKISNGSSLVDSNYLNFPRKEHTCNHKDINKFDYVVWGGNKDTSIVQVINFSSFPFWNESPPDNINQTTAVFNTSYLSAITSRFNHQADYISEWDSELIISGGRTTSNTGFELVNKLETLDTYNELNLVGYQHSSLYIPKKDSLLVSGLSSPNDSNRDRKIGFISESLSYKTLDIELIFERQDHDMIIISEDENKTKVLVVGGASTNKGEIITINH